MAYQNQYFYDDLKKNQKNRWKSKKDGTDY